MRWTCRKVQRFIPEVAEGLTMRPIAFWVHRHIRRCPPCLSIWRQHERLTALLFEFAKSKSQPPSNLWQFIVLRLTPRHQIVRRTVPTWRWAIAVIAVMTVLVFVVRSWFIAPKFIPLVERPISPDAFATAVLHQHLIVTAETPLNNFAFTAGAVLMAGEQR